MGFSHQRSEPVLILALAALLLMAGCTAPGDTGGTEESLNEGPPASEESRPQRPETVDLRVTVEQIEVTLPFALLDPPSLPFSTYLHADFVTEEITGSSPGVRAFHPGEDRPMSIEVTMLPGDSEGEAARAAFDESVESAGGYWIEAGVPIRPWAAASAIVHHRDYADTFFLIEHDGRRLLMRQQYAWRLADAFAPVVEGFIREWQWDDGTFLEN